MEAYKRVLSLLGLALRGGNLAVGEEPVEAAARGRQARVLLLARDAADNTRRRAEHFALAGQCLWLQVPFTKEELGRALGRTSVALVAVTDAGLAGAAVRRLAEADSARYGEAAERLEVKARRAAERRAEQTAHERNLRRGKRRPPRIGEAPGGKPALPKRAAPVRGSDSPPSGKRRPNRPPEAASLRTHSRPVKKGKGSFRKREG